VIQPTFYVGSADSIPLEDNSVHCIVTSPPYWKARDYGHGPNQLGLEDAVADYIDNLVNMFDDSRRVLHDKGVAWIIIGDSYNTRAKVRIGAHNPGLGHSPDQVGGSANLTWQQMSALRMVKHSSKAGSHLKDKDLTLIPARLGIRLVDRGWYLRASIIWSKPYGSPEKVQDRPFRTHEHILMLTKTDTYRYFPSEENRSSVWEIPPGSKYTTGPAVLPPALAERCIRASTETGDTVLDPFAGSGTVLHAAAGLGRYGVGVDLTDDWWKPDAVPLMLDIW
jgi:site-specific DNA-methyltransferase (cytosine-N4-specific)